MLGDHSINKVDSFMHLGVLIGNRESGFKHMDEKFNRVERSLYSLYSLGCRPDGFHPLLSVDIYKKFCQSLFYYGLEVSYLNKTQLQSLNTRQNVLLRRLLGLSKFSSISPIYDALNVMKIEHVYSQHKILFMQQVQQNDVTCELFYSLFNYDETHKLGNDSFITAIKLVSNYLEIELNLFNKKLWLLRLVSRFAFVNTGLVETLKFIYHEMIASANRPHYRHLVSLLLYVVF